MVVLGVIFSLSSACAADLNDTQAIPSDDFLQTIPGDEISLDEDEDNSNPDIGVVSPIENNSCIQDDQLLSDNDSNKIKSFSDLQNLINNAEKGSTITLNNDYIYDEGFTKNGVDIKKPLTIDGNGHKLDGDSKSRVFYLEKSNIVLKNILFANGNTPEYGGAIYGDCGANLVIDSCNFTKCYAGSAGGAIFTYTFVSNCSINSCHFTDCSSGYISGAVHNDADDSRITFCDFTRCKAKGGGAMCNRGDDTTISDCNFRDCYALLSGGSLDNCADNCIVRSCNFINSRASQEGGAIRNAWGSLDLTVVSCNFTNCKASFKGGVLYSFSHNLHMISCNFVKCCSREGGIAFLESNSALNFTSCNFTDCSASYRGGSFFIEGKSEVNIDKCIFKNGHANGYGGVFYLAYGGGYGIRSIVHIKNSDFINCDCPNSGAVIHNQAGTGTVESSNFVNCYTKDMNTTPEAVTYNSNIYTTIDLKNCNYNK